jgi:endo-alpha-1,4-polygalactosaminidase (GH114 family)
MTHKVVYNDCYGRYEYSDEAVKWLEQNGTKYMKDFIAEYREVIENDKNILNVFNQTVEERIAFHIANEFPRHNLDLVRCVEELGSEKASGRCAELSVCPLKGRMYRIEDYDGLETVMEPDDYEFITIDEDER